MSETLRPAELVELVRRVFRPGAGDDSLAFLVDLPDEVRDDHGRWRARRELVRGWYEGLLEERRALGLENVSLVYYRNVHRNNADLPDEAHVLRVGLSHPEHANELVGIPASPFDDLFESTSLLIAATELSATAPLKLAAKRHGFRAATMPGFSAPMIPALRLDWEEIHERCVRLKHRLDAADAAEIVFDVDGTSEHRLTLDLRHREAVASGGLVRVPGTAGNLPSGETYIVPYEGELSTDPSRTEGVLPLELRGELLLYHVRENRVVTVEGEGEVAGSERVEVEREPAYCNLAELGLGVLADYGLHPIGEILLDEKLGLHLALGRSDHFGGHVGAADFTSPDRVVHIDRVYLPELQPRVRVSSVDLVTADGRRDALLRDGEYV